VAQELCVLAALAPVAVSNIAVKYNKRVYAFDASLGYGAVVTTESEEDLVEDLWLGSDKRGCYTRLDSPAMAMLAAAGEETHDLPTIPGQEEPKKGPLLYYDFVEFFGGSGRVSECMAQLGHSVAPCLDLSGSQHYDLTDCRLLEWCLHLIEQGRFAAFLSEPPCTSFSPAAHPAVRSYKVPEGFDLRCPKTFLGNQLANRSFVLLRHGRRSTGLVGKNSHGGVRWHGQEPGQRSGVWASQRPLLPPVSLHQFTRRSLFSCSLALMLRGCKSSAQEATDM